MDLLQGSDSNLRIDLRGLDVLVSEQRLDVADGGDVSALNPMP